MKNKPEIQYETCPKCGSAFTYANKYNHKCRKCQHTWQTTEQIDKMHSDYDSKHIDGKQVEPTNAQEHPWGRKRTRILTRSKEA